MSEPPGELLGRLRPIPTFRDHPAAIASDIEGIDLEGTVRHVAVASSPGPVLLLFLSSGCEGCRDLWSGIDDLRRLLPAELAVVVVTRGEGDEDRAAVALVAPPGAEVVMSSAAYDDFMVAGPPFCAVVQGGEVRTEAVAWGVEETAHLVRTALGA